MKPNFALSLSFEGIRLLHRAAGGWRGVGEVALGSPDLTGELAALRRMASDLEPAGVRCKLIVPNSQIKYLTVETIGLSVKARRKAAEVALENATPYGVDDLVYDISQDGPKTHVAAVARETLAEAEAFAEEHRFHPVSFVAIPGDEPYLGEPFFGPTTAAATLLEEGEELEPDGIAVVVVGEVDADPDKPVVSVESPEPEEAVEPDEEAEPETTAETDVKPVPQTIEEAEASPDATEASDAASEPQATEETDATPATTEAPDAAPEPDAPEGAADETAEPDAVSTALELAKSGRGKRSRKRAKARKNKETVVAADLLSDADGADPDAQASMPEAEAPDVADAASAAEQSAPRSAGFASRRAAAAPPTKQLDGAKRGLDAPVVQAADVKTAEPVTPISPDSSSLAPEPKKSAPAKSGFLSRRKPKKPSRPSAEPLVARGPEVATPTDEAERMTVFGARKGAEVGGKPRFLGLIMTIVLLIFLAGVAAWASVFLDDGLARFFGNRDSNATASVTAPVTPDTPTVPDAPAADPGVQTASLDTGSLGTPLTDEDSAVLDALRDPVEIQKPEMTEAELEANYAVTGIWPIAPLVPEPPAQISIDDLYLTSIDPVSTSNDAVALPPVSGIDTDLGLAALSSPAAPGTRFNLDTRGLVVPTPDGTVSPDGVTVFLGRPPLVPPATPTRFDAEPELDDQRDGLARLRPQQRPADLAENTERAQLGGLTRSELAGLRPELRPRSVQQLAQDAALANAPSEPDDPVEEQAEDDTPKVAPAFENPTKFAAVQSRRPDTRPRNFARLVKRARQQNEKRQQQAEATQTASAASVAPRTVAPKIPSKTSVAKQATVKNAINLRKVNLIGVYGKPSRRRALVRLSNGRYKKVVVGDRLDGGRVSAIGDSELRYTRRGRNVILKMPRG